MTKVAPTDGGQASIPLLESEGKDMMLMAGGISTITFFSGEAPKDAIRARLAAILAKNPWVAGRITRKSKKERVHLVYDPEPADPSAAITSRGLFLEPSPSTPLSLLSPEMDYASMHKALHGSLAEVTTGSKCLNKDEALLKLTIVPGSSAAGGFALVFSVSHAIADGHTYYMLFNMVSEANEVVALEPKRKDSFDKELVKAVGEGESKFWQRTSYMMNCIGNIVFGGKAKVAAYLVDPNKVKQEKEKFSSGDGGVGFVSTNDLLTSSFGRMIKARLLEVAVNFRSRLSPKDTDAGNYEGALYLGNEDFAAPALVRKALSRGDGTYRRCGSEPPRPLPAGCEMARCRFGLITNWATFCKDITLGAGCTQTLHLPYFNPAEIPCEVWVVFKPTRDQLAVMVFTRHLELSKIQTNPMSVLGECVAPAVFPAAVK